MLVVSVDCKSSPGWRIAGMEREQSNMLEVKFFKNIACMNAKKLRTCS
jgi:hypothetical protein